MKLCLECRSTFADDKNWRCPECGKAPVTDDGFTFFAPEFSEENEHFPDAFGELFELESGHFWFRARNQLILWAIQKYFPQARNFLEIGCGTGYVLNGVKQTFPKMKLCGSEIFRKGLGFARKRLPDVNFMQMDARRMPFSSEFDLIGAFDVLEHIQEDETVLNQMRQSVTEGTGGIVLTVPQHQFLWSYVDEYSCHVRRYSVQEMREKVERAGFEVLHTTSFVSLLLPPMLAARMVRGNNRENFDPQAEFRISPVLNKSFETIMGIERALVKTGVSLPFGGSLLIVARAKPIARAVEQPAQSLVGSK